MRGGADPAVELQQVSKSFGEKPILRDVSFQVHAGEALGILGRSGTGKSVTLKLIISLLKPEQGQIWIEGEDITGLHAQGLSRVRRKMGFLFQGAALFDSLTLYENLALPLLRLTSKSPAQVEVIIERVLREVGLADDKQRMPSELSGGMRKRAGLARALVLEPRILLVDEPSSGLDRITASEIDELLLREKVERRTTLIVVTHDVRGARRLADRIAVLDQGRLIADGTVEEVQHSENEIARSLCRSEAMSVKKESIGLFVIGGLVLFGIGMFLIGDRHQLFARHAEYYTGFTNLSGLTTGAKVRVSGLDAGEVLTIEAPDSPAARFHVRFRIDARLRAPVRSDSVVTIGREGVVGGTYLSVRPGSSQAPQADALATIPSAEPTELSALLDSTAGLLDDVRGAFERCHVDGIERE